MKATMKKALAVVLTMVMLLGVLPIVTVTTSAQVSASPITNPHRKTNLSGSADRWIKNDTYWDTEGTIQSTPLTFEAVIKHPNQARYGGQLLGSYVDDSTPHISFGIGDTGRPVVRIIDEELKAHQFMFYGNGYPYYSSTYSAHMTFTIDPEAKTVTYYENGEFVETKQGSWGTLPTDLKYRVGGDFREGNTNNFKAAINHIAIWDEPRTAEQVVADYNECATAWNSIVWDDDDTMIAAWDLTKQGENACRDRTGNGNDLIYHQGEGVRPDTFGSSVIEQPLTGTPETVEAWLYLPQCYDTRGGTFIGNYGVSGASAYFSFEIQNSGRPRCFINNGDGTSSTVTFETLDMRVSDWFHVAFVHDTTVTLEGETNPGVMHCYINGELKSTLACPIEFSDAILEQYCMFGGDRQGNGMTQRYNGYIKELRVYNDARTADEVASDYAGNVDVADENIVLYYDLRETPDYTSFEDLTGNGHDVTYNQVWYDEVLPVEEYAYSIAVVGDTQTITYSNPDKLMDLYQWIIDNKESQNIQYVIGLGDITEKGVDSWHKNYDPEKAAEEWSAAVAAITQMDGILPYSLIRGEGHDGVEYFNQYFGAEEGYTSQIDGWYEEGRIENVYHTFTVGDIDYMVLCLDFGAKDPVLEWANEVVAAHPAHRVIVTTHGYLEKDGSLLETGEAYCPSSSYYDTENNDGDDIWNEFVRKHPNIQMVMCGHMTCDSVVVSKQTGDYGNEVTQILIDPQNGLDTSSTPRGMVAMLYFSEDGEDVQVRYYSTLTGAYRPNSEFTTTVGSTVAPSYDNLGDDYLIVQDQENDLYSVVENDYFRFLGGSLRYSDVTDGYANIRFGYQFESTFDLENSNWAWNYGVAGDGLPNYKVGSVKTSTNVSSLVITDVPQAYYATDLEVQLTFDVTLLGHTYTAIDRVRTRSVLGVAQAIVKNYSELTEAREYAQSIIDACS